MANIENPSTTVPLTASQVSERASIWQSRKIRQKITSVISHLILIIGAFIMIVPFIWMLSTSFKAPGNTFVYPPEWIPRPFVWQNYVEMWQALPFSQFFLNSVKISTLSTIGQLLTCSMGAFAFSILKFKGRDLLFLLLIATLMIP
jgi:multiple sugar transport system permease protein